MEHLVNMSEQQTISDLYGELSVMAIIIMSILLFNDLYIYKRKFKDSISLMLFFGMFIGAFELLWTSCDGKPALKALGYFSAFGYVITTLLFAIFFNRFFLGLFNMIPKNKVLDFFYYHFQLILMTVLCLCSPWTKHMYWIDETGNIFTGKVLNYYFVGLLWFYCLTAIIPAFAFAFGDMKKNPAITEVARGVIVFGVMIPFFYLVQVFIYGDPESEAIQISAVISLGLVYLTGNVNTKLFLATQSKVAAVEADLHAAAKIQMDALPSVEALMEEANRRGTGESFRIHAVMSPAKNVGGDFYDFFMIDDDHLGLIIADVSEKGIPAAMFMMSSKSIIAGNAMMGKSPGQVLEETNRVLSASNREQMFVTVWLGILEISTGRLSASNGGHEYPIIKKPGGTYELIKDKHGFLIGCRPGKKYPEYELQLEPGSRLFVYTDGVVEATDTNMKMFGTESLLDVLNRLGDASPEELINGVKSAVNEYEKGMDQFDDITMLCLEYRG